MSYLVLELRPGEMMVVNGATIRFRSKCRVELMSRARFLFGKQIMEEHEAETLLRRLYYQMQIAYVGPTEQRSDAVDYVEELLARLRQDEDSGIAAALAEVEAAFASQEFYRALKLLRPIISQEGRPNCARPKGL